MLIGVPDYVPTEIVDGPVIVMPTAFGEFGEGLLNVSRVRRAGSLWPGSATRGSLYDARCDW